MPPQDKNRIEDLKRSLYSRNAPDINSRRTMQYSTKSSDLKTDWEHPQEEEREDPVLNEEYIGQKKPMSFLTKIFIGSAIFCLLAVGTGAFIFFNGGNFISGDNINVTMSGPVSVPGGTPVTFSIVVINKNNVALKSAELAVHFPAGATDPRDTSMSLEDYKESIGDIQPGGSITRTVDAVIFGEENAQKKILTRVVYGIAGSSSSFTKEVDYDVVVNSSPLSVSVSSVKEISSGQPFDMALAIKSNSNNPLKNVILKATYPFGYTFQSSSVKPASTDNLTWAIGDLPAGGSRNIIIHGMLTGEDTDLRAFHFSVGARSPSNPLAIGTLFMDTVHNITITKPFASLLIAIDNDSDTTDHVGQFGKPENVIVKWKNNLPEALSNVTVTMHLSGTAYDKNYVSAYSGFFRSATNDIIWNQQTNPELALVNSGDSGNLSFSVTPIGGDSSSRVQNPTLVMSGVVASDRTGNKNVPLATAPFVRTVKIASNISLSGRVVRSTGPFVNLGPIPPKAENKTTYTIVWSVDNTSNAVGNSIVTATIPPYVTWMDRVSPSGEDVTFDSNSGTITWNVGNVSAFTLGSSDRREVSFQVALQPSVDQVGQAPVILNPSTLTATDNWTKSALRSVQGFLTTSFSTDATFKPGDGTVVKGN